MLRCKSRHYARSHPSARRRPSPIALRTHFPTIQKTIRHARQLRAVQAPLFPRYIFVILDLGRGRWLSVRGTVGVSSPFSSEDRPVPVPEGIVETLIQNSDEANLAL